MLTMRSNVPLFQCSKRPTVLKGTVIWIRLYETKDKDDGESYIKFQRNSCKKVVHSTKITGHFAKLMLFKYEIPNTWVKEANDGSKGGHRWPINENLHV